MPEEAQSGTLYIISTPIGNLEDISIRAIQVLSKVNLIASEDTRKTNILLKHYNIVKPLISYFSYNEERRRPELIQKLKSGLSIALVSEAGTPGISDPAFKIIRAAIDEKINIISLPGATAFLPALIVSGLPIDRFIFVGFLPVKKGRRSKLEQLIKEMRTIVLYEAPHRILRTLNDLREYFGNRQISLSRELTKKFEEHLRGDIESVYSTLASKKIRGEFVIIISPRNR